MTAKSLIGLGYIAAGGPTSALDALRPMAYKPAFRLERHLFKD